MSLQSIKRRLSRLQPDGPKQMIAVHSGDGEYKASGHTYKRDELDAMEQDRGIDLIVLTPVTPDGGKVYDE